MTCEQLQENMVDYLDGILVQDKLNAVETHLSGCEQCRQEVQELKQTLTWIKQADGVTPPATLRRDVLSQLEREARKKPHRFHPWFAHAAAAAAVFIMLVAGNVALPSTMKLASEVPPAMVQEEALILSSPANDTEAPTEPGVMRAAESDSNEKYDATSVAVPDGDQTNTASYDTTSVAADSEEQPAKRAISPRILFNLVSVPLFLLLAWLTLRKKREAMPNE